MRSDQESLDLFRVYLDQIGRHPLLTREDEIELSQVYEAGGDAQRKLADCAADDPARPDLEAVAERGEWARRKMIESNLRLVVAIARRFSATGLPLADRVQEGNLGLLRAVEKFDWHLGFKFSTYATWWIRQAIARGAADRGARAIRLPVHVDEQVGRLWRTHTRLLERLGREPSDDELAEALDLPTEKVLQLKDTTQAVTSLDAPVGEDGAALADFLEDGSAVGPTSWPWTRSAWPPWGRSSTACRSGSGRSSSCASGWTRAPPGPSRRWGRCWGSRTSGPARSSGTPWPLSAVPRSAPASRTSAGPPDYRPGGNG
jgi:RNA polymerase sigma factor (sigma-70 family)